MTSEFWQYDTRIGRRLNLDPAIKEYESPYSAFSGNPIWFSNFNGADTTLPTVDGQIWKLGGEVTTFDGSIQSLQGSDVTVQPGAGTIKTFTVGDATFVATFGSKSGRFKGYRNSSNLNQSFEDYQSELQSQLLAEIDEEQQINKWEEIGIWDRTLSQDQANRNLIGFGINLTMPTIIIKPFTIALQPIKCCLSFRGWVFLPINLQRLPPQRMLMKLSH